jgi:ribulose-5-phosphate 4-epimerase/fuculose-1-phosphate aldolase
MTYTQMALKEYVKTCIHLGSYHELIQGSGGNFSVKEEDILIIKSSGRVLAETTETSGFVKCSIEKLKECMKNPSIPIEASVIGGSGEHSGDQGAKPSMEVFFHLLPHKWCIHIHPITFLVHLCQSTWTSLKSSYSVAYIPYLTPGKDLSFHILNNYKGERVLFLKNHGIIVCGASREEVYTILDDLYIVNNISKFNKGEFSQSYALSEYIESRIQEPVVLKHCKSRHVFHGRLFLPITPDISLFLKHSPMVKEVRNESLEHLFDSYYKIFSCAPSIIKIMNNMYICAKTHHRCVMIEEILDAYLEIYQNSIVGKLDFFDDSAVTTLTCSESEKYRLGLQ